MEIRSDVKHVGMYLRISQEKKGEDVETLENHRLMLIEFCRENNLTYEEFGEVVSGGKTEITDRPQLQNLLRNIERFDAILCVELSRISRNGLISQTVKQFCIDYDKPILTPLQTYDLANSENDRLMYDFGSIISSHEHGVIGKRSKNNKMQMSKSGLHVSGNVPFGYRRNSKTKKLEIYEEEAKVVRYIFQLHSKGYGNFKIRDILNEEGYKTGTGKFFSIPTIRRILKNQHYKGWTVFNDRKRIKKNQKVTYKIIDTIVTKDTHPAIIPVEVWDAANRDREERIVKFTREKSSTDIIPLKDLVYCAVCERKMAIRKDQKGNEDYMVKTCEYLLDNGEKCPNCGIRYPLVEEKVYEDINEFKAQLLTYLEEIESEGSTKISDERNQKITQLEKRILDVKNNEKNLIDLALQGIFTHEEIKDKKQELLDEKSRLEQQYNNLISSEPVVNIENVTERVNGILDTIDNLDKLNQENVNQALKTFIKKVYYSRVIPDDLLKKSTRSIERKLYPFEVTVEYHQV